MFYSRELKVKYQNHRISDWRMALVVPKSIFYQSLYNLYNKLSSSSYKDWHVRQESQNERARNWAGQKPVPDNGPVVGNKQSQKGKIQQELCQAVATKGGINSESPQGWCRMEMYRGQHQEPGNILCLFRFTSVFEENFSLGKPRGSKTTKGILSTGLMFLGIGKGQQCLESNENDVPGAVAVTETN